MPAYFIYEIFIFLLFLVVFKRLVIEVMTDRRFWKVVVLFCAVGLPWDFFAMVFNMWSFTGVYIFGTAPFGTPLFEEIIFCILMALGVTCFWRRSEA